MWKKDLLCYFRKRPLQEKKWKEPAVNVYYFFQGGYDFGSVCMCVSLFLSVYMIAQNFWMISNKTL